MNFNEFLAGVRYGDLKQEKENAPRGESPQNLFGGAAARPYHSVVVYEPKDRDDVQTVIDYLKRREPAIINLDKVNIQQAQRILDFMAGAVYALSGRVHNISGKIYLLTPDGIEISTPKE